MLYLLFQIGPDRYAVEARQAVEVLPFLELKRLPHAPRGVAGCFNYRGRHVTAIDLCELTYGRPAGELLSTRIILLKYQVPGQPAPSRQTPGDSPDRAPVFGLIAEHATGMMHRDARDFEPTGVRAGGASYHGPILMDGQGPVQLLHPEHLLTEAVRALIAGQLRPELSSVTAPPALGAAPA